MHPGCRARVEQPAHHRDRYRQAPARSAAAARWRPAAGGRLGHPSSSSTRRSSLRRACLYCCGVSVPLPGRARAPPADLSDIARFDASRADAAVRPGRAQQRQQYPHQCGRDHHAAISTNRSFVVAPASPASNCFAGAVFSLRSAVARRARAAAPQISEQTRDADQQQHAAGRTTAAAWSP